MAYCYMNGRFIPEEEAKISVFDLGFLRGWGVFDFAYARGNKIFYGLEHLQRLQNSARVLKIDLPYSIEVVQKKTEELLQKNGSAESLIRWVVSGGTEDDGKKPTFIILNERYVAPSQKLSESGVSLQTVELKREIPNAKSLNYQIRYSHLSEMRESGVFELLYVIDKQILECTTSNIFLVKGDNILSAKDEVLPGITRQIVIDLAKDIGIRVQEKRVTLEDLMSADEVFITSTTKKILPVNRIDSKILKLPGKITQELTRAFLEHEKKYFSD